jgi:Domain of unknown function (DUF4440)
MKNLLLFFFLISGTHAFCQSAEADKINQLHKRKFLWMISKNYDSLNWIADETMKFIHSNGWTQTKKDFIDDLKSGKLNYTSIVIAESSVNVYNAKSAVVTGKGTFKGLMPDQSEFNINLLYTEVYVRSKKQWKLVSRQACKLL